MSCARCGSVAGTVTLTGMRSRTGAGHGVVAASVAASSRPTANTRGAAGTRSVTIRRPWVSLDVVTTPAGLLSRMYRSRSACFTAAYGGKVVVLPENGNGHGHGNGNGNGNGNH